MLYVEVDMWPIRGMGIYYIYMDTNIYIYNAINQSIVEFLISSGLQAVHMDSIVIKGNGSVTIRDLNSSESKILIEKIHNKFFSGKKLYCNGIIPLTPEKEAPGSPAAAAAPTPSRSGPPSATPTLPTPISPISPQFSQDPLQGLKLFC